MHPRRSEGRADALHEWEETPGRRLVVRAGALVFAQGALADGVVLLHSGAVKVVRCEANGSSTIIDVHMGPDILGSSDAIRGGCFAVSAYTISEATISLLPRDAFLHRAFTKPDCARQLCGFQSRTLQETVSRISSLACLSGRDRVARLLGRLITTAPESPARCRATRVRFPLKEHEMARLLAITPEHFSRLLNGMMREGILAREKGWLVVRRPECLSGAAEEYAADTAARPPRTSG